MWPRSSRARRTSFRCCPHSVWLFAVQGFLTVYQTRQYWTLPPPPLPHSSVPRERKAAPQAVGAREPERASDPQLSHHAQDLLMKAYRAAAYLRRLIEHVERVHSGPCGLEQPVAALVKFICEAHATWTKVKGFCFALLCSHSTAVC